MVLNSKGITVYQITYLGTFEGIQYGGKFAKIFVTLFQ